MAEKKLNKQQLEAIEHGTGPLLIIAGAGTGKTTVVTERVKWLIGKKEVKPAEILALTFTEKAAREMEERIDVALPYGYTQMWVLTFHSFCDRVLRDEGLQIGLDTDYSLLSEADAIALFRKHLFEFDLEYFRPLGNPNKFIGGMLQHFSRLADEDISVDDYIKWANKFAGDELEKKKWQELAKAYLKWSELKITQGVMEFGDLITYALKLFRQRPNVLFNYHHKFKYLLVDEFQDTNYAQNQLVILLAQLHQNLTVVADDDQAIYRWRGAAISNVIQFRKTYPKAKLVTLVQNYRSTQQILDRAYDLIQHNNPDRLEVKEKIDKKLVAVRQVKGVPVEFVHSDRVENEADAIVKQIELLKNADSGLSYKDFAILVRANNHAESVVRALLRADIPHQFLGPGQLFKQPEIKDLISYLKVLVNLEDDTAFYRVLAMDYWGISPREIIALTNLAKRQRQSLFTVSEKVETQAIKKIVDLVSKHLNILPKFTAGQIVYDFLDSSGLLAAMVNYQSPLGVNQANNIAKFFEKIRGFEASHEDSSVQAVVDWLDLSMELGESPLATDTDWTINDAVNILTVHSAKGLEFPVVFLINLVSQRFPTSQRQEQIPIPDELVKEILPEGDFHIQEERRLFYVGMTRAQDRLFLTAANYYGDGKREKKLSSFIFEALGPDADNPAAHLITQPSLLDWQPAAVKQATTNISTPQVLVDYLSYSQIQTFIDCPLHYKAKYVLKISTPPTAAQSFGSSIHLVLRDLYQQPGADIFQLYKKNWIRDGYTNKEHEQQYYKKGEKFLSQFLEKEYDPKVKPAFLEGSFIAPIKLGGKYLKIGGKIDRVDVLPDGSIEVIDYKTGANVPTQKDVDTDLQMSFYALAATILKEPPFAKNPDEVKLSLYYFDAQQKISTTRTLEQLQEAVTKIFGYADQIATSDFKCSGSLLCKNCEFKMLCDIKTSE